MPLPTKSRYTITEAAKFINSATGEAVTQAQILDWGTQGLYRLHLAIEHRNIRAIGEAEIIQVRDSITELRLSSGQAAILGRGERVGVSACWHNGIACNFVRSSTYDSSWRPDTVYFGAAGLVLLGAELAAFTASIAEPQQPAKQVNAMKKAALIAELEYKWPSIEADISDATRNGLKAAAHTQKHGEWDRDKAHEWAVSRGKIKQDAPVHGLAAMWSGAVTRNTIGDR